MSELEIYNTLTRKKEKFQPLNPPYVGMYVCGPTVYGDAHLGHARAAITFDIVYRYLKHLGYKVRYVSNITDVGHLVGDADSGEDKIQQKARLEKLEPMEIANYYTNRYRINMQQLNVLPPSIQPLASGHIPEQMELIEKIIQNGFAYLSNGSVYFDVVKYNQQYNYGKLSGRKLEELYEKTRELQGQEEKRNPYDFALWKKADPTHIMRWKSPWSEGFPGWHVECSAMGHKYLGAQFDIHGGGLDLQFPHHESEIAQSVAAFGVEPVKYWMHNNLITINGQKMSKSLNNFITLFELFEGTNPLISKPFDPMTVRFFILQAHYRSPLDFSNNALLAAEKGLEKLQNSYKLLDKIVPHENSSVNIKQIFQNIIDALNDDFNTPVAIAQFFEISKIINSAFEKKISLTHTDIELIKETFEKIFFDVLGIKFQLSQSSKSEITSELIDLILQIRQKSKLNKDYQTSDFIRNKLNELGIEVKDTKDGYIWEFKK